MTGAKPFRDELLERVPDRLGRGTAEHLLGGAIEEQNSLVAVHRDNGIHGGIHDPCEPLFTPAPEFRDVIKFQCRLLG